MSSTHPFIPTVPSPGQWRTVACSDLWIFGDDNIQKNSVLFRFLKVIKELFLVLATCVYVYVYILNFSYCIFNPLTSSYQLLTLLTYCQWNWNRGNIIRHHSFGWCNKLPWPYVTLVWKCKWVTLSPLRFFSNLWMIPVFAYLSADYCATSKAIRFLHKRSQPSI